MWRRRYGNWAIAPIGALMSGFLADFMGVIPLLLTCAMIGIIFPYFIWFFTKIRNLEVLDHQNMVEAIKSTEEVLEVIEVVE